MLILKINKARPENKVFCPDIAGSHRVHLALRMSLSHLLEQIVRPAYIPIHPVTLWCETETRSVQDRGRVSRIAF